jgi:hypothetical protein
MNWIQIPNLGKLQIKEWIYSGPLKKHQIHSMWASSAFHSNKIICPNHINLSGLKGFKVDKSFCKIDDIYYEYSFKVISTRELSKFKDHSIVKIEVEDLTLDKVSKDTSRDLKLSDIFDL